MMRTFDCVYYFWPHKEIHMGSLAKQLGGQSDVKVFKKGGAVKGKKHDDAAEDKKMMAAEFKKRGLKCGGKSKK